MQHESRYSVSSLTRIRLWYAALLCICGLIVLRLFYLQVIKYGQYETAALSGQLKEYEIPAQRGIIEVHNGETTVPIVLNESKYTLFADPKFITDARGSALAVQKIIGGDADEYEKQMKTKSRYAVLAKKLTKDQKDKIDAAAIAEAKDLKGKDKPVYLWKGVGTREVPYRTYPQGSLAAQLLGFVDDEGAGKYGIEQALNNELKGKPGQIKAITDANGVPLAANKDNTLIEPQAGKRLILTIDIGMQQQVEDLLKKGLDHAHSQSGSALILEAKTGAVKAMANYPTYNPAEFYKVEDASLFSNQVISAQLEVGSIMKPLTAAAAIDLGVINKDTTYYDPAKYVIDGATIKNVEEDGGAGTKTIGELLRLSLNTGATWLLMQMGGGQINQQARVRWHDYMVNHYHFGKATGIEQGYEAEGSIPDPNDGFGLNIQYANTAFGQGMSATPLQMASAYAAVLNGGTYYRPHLVDETVDSAGKVTKIQPEVLQRGVVKSSTSQATQELMEYVFTHNHVLYGMPSLRPEYSVGGKTGTAQIAKPGGGYYDDRFNGTFVGFVGGNEAQYIIMIRVNEPKIGGYAGARAAAPVFSDMANMLMDNFSVTPKQ